VTRPTPLLPASTARQNASLPIPFGLRQPIPVITARRMRVHSTLGIGGPSWLAPVRRAKARCC